MSYLNRSEKRKHYRLGLFFSVNPKIFEFLNATTCKDVFQLIKYKILYNVKDMKISKFEGTSENIGVSMLP